MNIKTIIFRTAAVAVLALSGVAAVAAQDTPTTPDPDGPRGRFGERFGGRDDRFPNFDLNTDLIQATVEEFTGLSSEDLRVALRDGGTLSELIVANGETVDAFIEAATAPIFAEVDAAVEAGSLDADRAETLKANVTTRLTERIESPRRGGLGRGSLNNINGELVEQYTGLTPNEARAALRDGTTMAELIEANGASVDEFIAEAVAQAEEAIQARADERLANLETTITALVNGERPNTTAPAADGE